MRGSLVMLRLAFKVFVGGILPAKIIIIQNEL